MIHPTGEMWAAVPLPARLPPTTGEALPLDVEPLKQLDGGSAERAERPATFAQAAEEEADELQDNVSPTCSAAALAAMGLPDPSAVAVADELHGN